jgi:Cys-tRNA(Pro) deacylase
MFMPKPDHPITPAIRMLREKKITFEPHLYEYKEHGGTRVSAQALGVDEHCVVKTIVLETDTRAPLIVLMHGDREVSTRTLARIIGVRAVSPCDPATVQKHTGYLVGGVSPFGTRKVMQVYAEKTIFDLPNIYINGGKRGFLVKIDPADLRNTLKVEDVEVGIE